MFNRFTLFTSIGKSFNIYFAMVVRVSPKYQVVLPKEVREVLAIQAGAKVSVIAKGGIAYIVPVVSLKQARGLVKTMEQSIPLRDKKDRTL